MNVDDRKETADIAELECRRYFDTYLQQVWPEQARALREHADQAVALHDANEKAHGGIKTKFSRLVMLLAVSGGAGAGVSKLLALLG